MVITRISEQPTPVFLVLPAVVAILLGGATLLGWYAGIPGLLAFSPGEPPVFPGSGIAFLIAGTAFLALPAGRRVLAVVLGIVLAVAALLAPAQQLLAGGEHTGTHPLTTVPFHEAAAFLLLSAGIFLRAAPTTAPAVASRMTCSVLSSLTMAIAAAILLGTALELESAFRWGSSAPASPHSAIALALLGAGLLVFVLHDPQTGRLSPPPAWLPLPLASGGIVTVLCIWGALSKLPEPSVERIRSLLTPKSTFDQHLPALSLAIGVTLVGLCTLALSLAQQSSRRTRERRRTLLELQQAHSKLRKAHNELELRVNQRTTEAVRVNEDLQKEIVARKHLESMLRKRADVLSRADRRKNAFLAILGHELRNPLATLSLALETMPLDGPLSSSLLETRETMQHRLRYIVRLVDDLLDVSRISTGNIRLRPRHIQLASVLSRCVDGIDHLVNERQQSLFVSVSPKDVRLRADPVRLEQIVYNLLSNASKYTPQGGNIWLTATAEADWISIVVRDDGKGIPPEILPRLFRYMPPAEDASAVPEGGLGVGLTLVRRLVELHGGTVTARSEGPGRGSEFRVRLARNRGRSPVRTTPETRTVTPEKSLRGSESRRVLVVEDRPALARMTQRLLRSWGHEVFVAHRGVTALAIAERQRIDLALVDIGLPGMNGYQLARHLREELSDIILVAVSGYAEPLLERRAREAGFDLYLTKPVDLAVLETILADRRPLTPR